MATAIELHPRTARLASRDLWHDDEVLATYVRLAAMNRMRSGEMELTKLDAFEVTGRSRIDYAMQVLERLRRAGGCEKPREHGPHGFVRLRLLPLPKD